MRGRRRGRCNGEDRPVEVFYKPYLTLRPTARYMCLRATLETVGRVPCATARISTTPLEDISPTLTRGSLAVLKGPIIAMYRLDLIEATTAIYAI
jgi:hypothetical protein